MKNPIRRYFCYGIARLEQLIHPVTDPQDAATLRLPWRRSIRRRRRGFPQDVPAWRDDGG